MLNHLSSFHDHQKISKVGSFYKKVSDANIEYFKFWKEETFLHWDFWLTLLITVLPWIIWWRFHKRESRARLLTVGLFVIFITSWFDFIGTIFGFWFYTGKNVPTIPSFMPWDFSLFPVVIMLLVQVKPKTAPWKKALLFSACCAFIGEPIFIWLHLYILLKWKLVYSFPIYFVIYMLASKLGHAKTYDPL